VHLVANLPVFVVMSWLLLSGETGMSDTADASLLAHLTQTLLERSFDAVSERRPVAEGFFPHGVSYVRVRVAVAAVGEAEIELRGPDSRTPLREHLPSEIARVAKPSIAHLDKATWQRGEQGTLQIVGSNFTSPTRVRIANVATYHPKLDPETSKTNIVLDIAVDQAASPDSYDVEIYFDNGTSALAAKLFKII